MGLIVSYFLCVTFDLISLDKLKVLQVKHLLSLQKETEKPATDACPCATINDVLPSPGFIMTPALP